MTYSSQFITNNQAMPAEALAEAFTFKCLNSELYMQNFTQTSFFPAGFHSSSLPHDYFIHAQDGALNHRKPEFCESISLTHNMPFFSLNN